MSQNIKKVRIARESLPELATKNNFFGYRLRYRIISEDRNRTSAWSPIYDISAKGIIDVAQTQYTYTKKRIIADNARTATQVTLAWTPPTGSNIASFDVFVNLFVYKVTNVSSNGTQITFTTSKKHRLKVGDSVSITNLLNDTGSGPSGYNLSSVTISAVTGTTFTVLSSVSSTVQSPVSGFVRLDNGYAFYRTTNTTNYDVILPAIYTADNTEQYTDYALFQVQVSTSDKTINKNLRALPNEFDKDPIDLTVD